MWSTTYQPVLQLFREFERRLSPTMRQQHDAGHKAFVDYSGKRVAITNPVTGGVRTAEIFVAVLGGAGQGSGGVAGGKPAEVPPA